jgi:carbon-monoxide dehydrogenase medium subunit
MLLALGATVRVRSATGWREVTIDEFVARHPSKLLLPGELVVEVVVPRAVEQSGNAFLKFARTAFDYALCGAAASLRLESGVIGAARVAVGALRPLPARLPAAEKLLVGKQPTAAVLSAAAAAGAAEAEVGADFRASVEYRREVCGVQVRRALELAASRAAGRAS